MFAIKILLLVSYVAAALGEVTQEEVDAYLQGIEDIETEAYNWSPPRDASKYTAGLKREGKCEDVGVYDFIVVGGGTAGTIVANRLSEIQEWKVLVVEGGGLETNYTRVPSETNYLSASDYNWGYISQPNKYFGGYANHRAVFPAGRGMGGGSIMNYELYARGNKEDYNQWAKMGNYGWSYSDCLPYFKKVENVDFEGADPGYHGRNGPINVQIVPYKSPLARAFLKAQIELGRPQADYNGRNQLGFSYAQVNEIDGSRDSSSRGYWEPIKNRPNLKVIFKSLVTQIRFNRGHKRAVGVKFARGGKCYFARAKKEVILSAGAIASPQILMLSGVGPRMLLKQLKIPVLKDSPVGKNLWTHLTYSELRFSVNFEYPKTDQETLVREYLNGTGFLTAPSGIQVVGFTRLEDDRSSIPDMEYVFASGPPKPEPYAYYRNVFGYSRDTYESISRPAENITNYMAFIVALYTKTRGTISLKSRDPSDYPLIYMPFFEDGNEDVETILRGIRDLEVVAQTASMQQYDAKPLKLVHPLCKSHTWGTDDFWECMIRNLAFMLHHYGGTCKMGGVGDSSAVVNPRLQVYGIAGLRVVDASIIPTPSSGHTMTIAQMIAEKASDMIKVDHLLTKGK